MSRIILYCIIFSGFICILAGVPIVHQEYNSTDTFAPSSRCAAVGDLHGLMSCLGNTRISGGRYIYQVIQELNDVNPGMGIFLLLVSVFHITLVPVIVRRLTHEDS